MASEPRPVLKSYAKEDLSRLFPSIVAARAIQAERALAIQPALSQRAHPRRLARVHVS